MAVRGGGAQRCGAWQCMAVRGGAWRCAAVRGGARQCMTVWRAAVRGGAHLSGRCCETS